MLDTFSKTFKLNHKGNIYAIGDIHGDIIPLIICLRDCCNVIKKKSNIILKKQVFNFNQNKIDDDLNYQMNKEWDDTTFVDNLNYEWCGDNAYVVFCGDLLDNVRGEIEKKPGEFPFEEARIFKFINAINKEAMEKNGRIFKILGNHDMYNLNGRVKTSYSSYVSQYAQNYDGYKNDADGRLDYFGKGKPGAKLIGEDDAYLFLMINDFIFVHGGISTTSISVDNIEQVNESLMKYIYDISENNVFDTETNNIENSLTFSNGDDDGLVKDRYFGFVDGKTEEEMCTVLYNRFVIICRDIKNKYNDISQENKNICNPNKMKLVIGHCNQNKITSDSNKIFKSGFSQLVHYDEDKQFIEEYTAPVFKGEPSKKTGIYGITVSCGDRNIDKYLDKDIDKYLEINFNKPSIFRLDVGMSRGFNLMEAGYKFKEYILSRTPQVLKIIYKKLNDPHISVIKSSYQNTMIHLTELDNNPYKDKYKKYKSKYNYIKQNLINNGVIIN